jgi:signal transduction histidine kinase
LNDIAYNLYSIKKDSAIIYANIAEELSTQVDYPKGKAKSFEIVGQILNSQGKYQMALEYYKNSLATYTDIDDKSASASTLILIGNQYWYRGNYPKALENYQEALKIYEALGDKAGISMCFINIGLIHSNNGNNEQALDYYEKNLKISEELGDKKMEADVLYKIGITHRIKGNYPQALKYFQKSLSIYEVLSNKKGISDVYSGIGIIYYMKENYPIALEYYEKASSIKEEINDTFGNCHLYRNIGIIYLKTSNYTKALNYTNRSYNIARERNLLNELKYIYNQYSEIYAATNKYKEAYEAYVNFKELNDSIFNNENAKIITGLEYQYAYEKEKQALEFERQKKEAVYEEKIKHQKSMQYFYIAGFVLMILIVVIIYRSFLQKRKSNQILKKQKNEIEENNAELKVVNATKDKFFSIIAHDLKNPLSTMLHLSQLLSDNFDKIDVREQKEYIGHIYQAIQNTYKLLENLLLWVRSQRGIIDFKPVKENLRSLVTETIELLHQVATNKSIELKNEIPANISVYVDKNMVLTVLRNLISNAIKFTHKGGEVMLKATATIDKNRQRFTEIYVIDNGIGVPPEVQSKLFRITENISLKGTENERGTGLGLILCQEFVEKHGGKIWLVSDEGKGSKFIFTLPILANINKIK